VSPGTRRRQERKGRREILRGRQRREFNLGDLYHYKPWSGRRASLGGLRGHEGMFKISCRHMGFLRVSKGKKKQQMGMSSTIFLVFLPF